MRQFTYKEPITTTFHAAGQTVSFINGVCELVDPTPIQLGVLDQIIEQKLAIETTPGKKKSKPSKRAAKKKKSG
jgi:hypothetical protein